MIGAQLAIIVVSSLIGGLILSSARGKYARSKDVAALTTTEVPDSPRRTVEGPVEVTTPAEPARLLPDRYEPDSRPEGEPAIWAWRVQRERDSEAGDNWVTADGGLAVGDFVIRDDWDRVQIEADELRAADIDDPYTADHLFLGDPEIDVYVEEYAGTLGDVGPFEDLQVSASVGPKTTTPDRYQATIIRDGDSALARGRVEGAVPTLRGGDEGVELAIGDLSARAEHLSGAARRRALVGASVIALGVGAAVVTLL